MSDLDEVTKDLGENYLTWKKSEKRKDELKGQFFAAIIDELKKQPLAEKLYTVEIAEDEEDAVAQVNKYNPGWVIDASRHMPDNSWEFILVEDPTFKPFTYVNQVDNKVYAKSIQAGSVQLDDERLKVEDPDLYEEITYVPEPVRRLRNLEDLPDETLSRLQKYVYEGRPVVKLLAPRKAKPEELE